MKKSSKLMALLLALALLLVACGGGVTKTPAATPAEGLAETTTAGETTSEGEELVEASADTLVVASTDLNGDFVNGFTNSSYDVWVRKLMGTYGTGYATYTTDEYGEYVKDETINARDPVITLNEDGSKTYNFSLNPALVWSDGQPITAKDYVFSILFAASPEWMAVGAGVAYGEGLLGYKAYHEGEANVFPGIKYIDDHTFEATIPADRIPYFYELDLVSVSPSPMHRYAPNLTIGADGSSLVPVEGYTVSDADKATLTAQIDKAIEKLNESKKALEAEMAEAIEAKKDEEAAIKEMYAGEFAKIDESIAGEEKRKSDMAAEGAEVDASKLLLQSSAYDIAQTYRFAPDVTSGAYKFVSFQNNAATVTLNDKYLGDFRGKKPTIPNVVVQKVNQTLDVDLAINGSVDIAPGVIEGEKIEKAKSSDQTGTVSYSRNGYGQIAFLTDLGATQYKEVRQAVAYLMDRNLFVQNVLGGYGVVGNGIYGLSQWMYQEKGEDLESKINHYTLNIDQANKLLDQTPYKYEKDGTTPWDVAKAKQEYDANAEAFSYWRYDDKGNQLMVNHYATTDNTVSDTIASQLPNNGKQVGLQYNMQFGDFATLMEYYYNPDVNDPKFTAFNLATNFTPVWDPYLQFHSEQIGNDNKNRLNVPEIDALSLEMRKIAPEDKETFANKWVDIQVLFNDYMPNIPLYSNEYFDIFNKRVEGLETFPNWDWADDIADIKLVK